MSADWGCAGARTGAAQGRRLGQRRGADWGCAWAQTGHAHGRRLGLRMGADWGCAGAQTGAAQGRRLGLCRGADWGCAGAQTGAAQGRRLGQRMGADRGCAWAQTGAAQERRLGLRRRGGGGRLTTGFWRPPQAPGSSLGGYWGPGQRVREGPNTQTGAVQERRLGLRRGADWGCAWAQTGAAHGRRLGLRRGADWGCAGAQTGAAHGRRLGLRRGADWGCAGAQTGAAHGRRQGLRMGADWGCAGAQTGAAQEGGGGAPHHRLLATPPGAGLLTRRLLGPGPACARGPQYADWGCAGVQTGAAQGRRLGLRMGADWGCAWAQTGAAQGRRLGLRMRADWGCAGAQTGAVQGHRLGRRRRGGGGASPQAFGDPPRRRAPHQEVIGARASVCARASPQVFGPALSGGGAPGGRSGWFPPGLAQLCMATGQQRLFLTGLMSVHGPGRMGEGPNSRPRRFLLAVPGGGGGHAVSCVLGGELPPMAKPRRPLRAGEPPLEGGRG